ncbi:hypothetical protein Tsubulata_041630 [Turnera subulata]|uniref:Protein BZR1 homolog n=1 Tax=Turnera subulata TaxID=218843 RepID=A0A9Q0GG05_9ROSI|nr:hypothetical protein Tsubulata_041630 [Turnera subulata]
MAGGSSSARSESDKERTKLRERQRRAITTKIFQGLRKHGGYHLSPRADINEVLRELAREAGWVVEADGTTYRCKVMNQCRTCAAVPNTSTNPTPTTSSTLIASGGTGGDCSTTGSPRRMEPAMVMINSYSNNKDALPTNTSTSSSYLCGDGTAAAAEVDIPLPFYMYNRAAAGLHHSSTSTALEPVSGGTKTALAPNQHQQGTYLQESRASNQNTPVGSPLQRTIQ